MSGLADAEWERHRPAVFGAAYRLLGSVADAEDVVQDVWLRAAAADRSDVVDLRAWLVTVAARRSYDILKSARVQRERYVGPWLPEPLLTGPDAAQPVLVDESVGIAMLLVMDELSPAERLAFVLHDVFEVPFDQIADVIGRSVPATRKLASRARERVTVARERPRGSRAEHERLVGAFRAAYEDGDVGNLIELLDPDATLVTDGGGVVFTARKIIRGGERIASVLVRLRRRWGPGSVEVIEVGGEPALAIYRDGRLFAVDTVQIRDGRITTYQRVLNPEKLRHLPGHT